jgi:UDP-N-acetylmuramoyl-L-alanyl-D-glutamate--2,6-diaminopimelate ligase
MGSIATRLADVAVLTSDNPRSEDPSAIIDEVRAGCDGTARLVVETDRRLAIAAALGSAGAGDVVVAGKGHESVQQIGDKSIEFNDRVVISEELARLGAGGAGS